MRSLPPISDLGARMELSFLPPVLCLLLLTSMALASQPDMDPKVTTAKDYIPPRRPITRIYHPPTSSCILRKLISDPLYLGPCTNSDPWSYTPQKLLMIKGTYFCLQATGPGKPVRLSIICTPEEMQWEVAGDSKRTNISSKLADGTAVCLDVEQDGTIVANPCSRQGSAEGEELDSQWFAMVTGPPNVDAAETKQ